MFRQTQLIVWIINVSMWILPLRMVRMVCQQHRSQNFGWPPWPSFSILVCSIGVWPGRNLCNGWTYNTAEKRWLVLPDTWLFTNSDGKDLVTDRSPTIAVLCRYYFIIKSLPDWVAAERLHHRYLLQVPLIEGYRGFPVSLDACSFSRA